MSYSTTPLDLLDEGVTTVVEPSFLNESRERLNDLIGTLGANVQGSSSTLADRLASLSSGGSGSVGLQKLEVSNGGADFTCSSSGWTLYHTWASVELGSKVLVRFFNMEFTYQATDFLAAKIVLTAHGVAPTTPSATPAPAYGGPEMVALRGSAKPLTGELLITQTAGTYDLSLYLGAYDPSYTTWRAATVKGGGGITLVG